MLHVRRMFINNVFMVGNQMQKNFTHSNICSSTSFRVETVFHKQTFQSVAETAPLLCLPLLYNQVDIPQSYKLNLRLSRQQSH